MEYNYNYIFFKYLYKKLDLEKLDKELENSGIKMIDQDNCNKRISKYFSLQNHGDTILFSDERKTIFKKLFDDDLDNVLENKKEEAINFVASTYQDYFHLNDKIEFKYYGPINDKFLAPSNCIVIGLNYIKYQLEEDNYEEKFERQEEVIFKMLNYIQNTLSKEKGINLASIAYDEVALFQPFVRL